MTSGDHSFETTHWSIVLAAGTLDDSQSRAALQELCERYWLPLYAFARRRGFSEHDAQDLTQGFFHRVIDKGVLGAADQSRGKFRTFLLAALKNYLANAVAHQQTLRRGGGQSAISLDLRDAEGCRMNDPVAGVSAEQEFDRRWAMALLDRVLGQLAENYAREGKQKLFEATRCYLSTDSTRMPYAQVAETIGSTESSVKVAVHRMRRRYRDLLESEIADTVSSPDQVDDEIRDLFEAMRSNSCRT